MKARSQSEHEAINRREYPGTRQLCERCGEPTERCEEDAIYADSGEGPLCVGCYDTANTSGEGRKPAPERIERIARDLSNCAESWEADACLLGNVTAEEIRDLCQWVIEPNAGLEPRGNRVGSEPLLGISSGAE